jgi:predicted nuclease of predicted toxin-antitoxin system
VKIVLDECVDWRLAREITGHEIKTARQMGWGAIANGELLALAAQSLDVFVTVDRNLSFQQHLPELPIDVIVLRARTNRLSGMLPLVPDLLAALRDVRSGSVAFVVH